MQIYVNWNTCLCKTTCDYASLHLQEKFCQSSLKVEKIQIYSQSQFGLGFLLEWFVWHVERLSCAMALVKDSVFRLLKHGFQLEFQRTLPILSPLLCFFFISVMKDFDFEGILLFQSDFFRVKFQDIKINNCITIIYIVFIPSHF